MFNRNMVPVDLAHMNALEKSLTIAADLARHYNAALNYVGVTTSQPSEVARTPEEYQEKLMAFAHKHAPDNGSRIAVHTSAFVFLVRPDSVE